MTNILLFGSSTKTGFYIKSCHKEFIENSNIYCFSSDKKSTFYLDLKSQIFDIVETATRDIIKNESENRLWGEFNPR